MRRASKSSSTRKQENTNKRYRRKSFAAKSRDFSPRLYETKLSSSAFKSANGVRSSNIAAKKAYLLFFPSF